MATRLTAGEAIAYGLHVIGYVFLVILVSLTALFVGLSVAAHDILSFGGLLALAIPGLLFWAGMAGLVYKIAVDAITASRGGD